jgi:hypothetical protein
MWNGGILPKFGIVHVVGQKTDLEIREYGRKDPLRWQSGTLYPQKLAPTVGGRSVGIVTCGLRPWSWAEKTMEGLVIDLNQGRVGYVNSVLATPWIVTGSLLSLSAKLFNSHMQHPFGER